MAKVKLRAVIKGFINHGIPLVAAVEKAGHFNALIGYWDVGSTFYIGNLHGHIRDFGEPPEADAVLEAVTYSRTNSVFLKKWLKKGLNVS